MDIRPYQAHLIDETVSSSRRYKNLLLVLPTGAGKTVIAAELTRRVNEASMRKHSKTANMLFLVHRRELLKQTINTLLKIGFSRRDFGLISAQTNMELFRPLQIASIQTLSTRLKKDATRNRIDRFIPKVVFIDEAHHVRANTWERVVGYYREMGSHTIGLTATPIRLDGRGLGNVFDSMLVGADIDGLVDDGYLCDFDVFTLKSNYSDVELKKNSQGEYSLQMQSEQMRGGQKIAKTLANYLQYADGKKTIHYAAGIEHSIQFVAEVNKHYGKKIAAHIDGSMDGNTRMEVIEGFNEGRYRIISNVDIITEGFDCPDAQCCILARKTASVALFRQMVGRVMRPKPDGGRAIILDVAGNVDEHGHPKDEIDWKLVESKHTPKMFNKKNAGLRKCPECGLAIRKLSKECSHCGFVFTKRRPPVQINAPMYKAKPNGKKVRKPGRKLNIPVAAFRRILYQHRHDLNAMKRLCIKHGANPGAANVYQRLWAEKSKKAVRGG